MEFEQWVAVALSSLVAIALTVTLVKMAVAPVRRRREIRERRERGRRAWDRTAWMDKEEGAK